MLYSSGRCGCFAKWSWQKGENMVFYYIKVVQAEK